MDMPISTSDGEKAATAAPHVAILPSSGMGHLTPFLRFAATLAAQGCKVTLLTIQPTVSSSESLHLSRFFSSFPHIQPLEFHLLPFNPSTASSTDPFFLHFEAIRRSAHLLPSLLTSSTPPFSALITDITLASAVANLPLPFSNYIFFTSSASMLSFCACFPTTYSANGGDFHIPGLPSPIPNSSIPPLLHIPTNLFTTQFVANGRALVETDGILVNTFAALEPETLAALNSSKVVPGLPPVIAAGPLEPCGFEQSDMKLPWLDEQPAGSVVYVSFGSRTALSEDQIKQLGDGLERSGCRFLWVVKSKVVDKDDQVVDLGDLVGIDFLERVKDRGLVVKNWVDQWEVLGHPAIAGFVSHCGWNSVTEAAMQGVPILAWPQFGDQKINAEVVERNGLGIWVKEWGWGREMVVMGDEIGRRVKELVTDAGLKASAARIGEKSRQAVGVQGTRGKALAEWIEMWSHRLSAAGAAL
ncbi:UDP-glycosyltransferase 708G1-like [Magnolia sinica]|uniref:UDP-glycosyltransferase 708G1-like n=1 Tax=Magnolia sinica TaxID=86752 RepID=UPI002658EC1F|nr:UDP-glycosyltransferase 708G1-like [Magnolia sinica]